MSNRVSPTFTCFVPLSGPAQPILPSTARLDLYAIERVEPVVGANLPTLSAHPRLARIETPNRLWEWGAPFVGLTQHLVYTAAEERRELVRVSAGESGPLAVLIPIGKSPEWWALAQDERRECLRTGTRGHFEIGLEFANVIYRRLYHARALPGSEWDFLTYFEFPPEQTSVFQSLLRRLRNVELNPEWRFVDRELEIWPRKLPAS
jgi:hypothetical protein